MEQAFLYIMAVFYIVAGVYHFVNPGFYLKIMPPYFPFHKAAVWVSGLAEVLLGVGLLFEHSRSFSAYGIIFLLVAVFPANVYMATSEKFHKVPAWIKWGRLPLQFVLVWWAYLYI